MMLGKKSPEVGDDAHNLEVESMRKGDPPALVGSGLGCTFWSIVLGRNEGGRWEDSDAARSRR